MMYLYALFLFFAVAICNVVRSNGELHTVDLIILSQGLQVYFEGDILLGTPENYSPVYFDIENGDLIVLSTKCVKDACKTKYGYNSSASSTYKPDGTPFEVDIGDVQYSGILSKDAAKIVDLEIAEQTFGEILDINGSVPLLIDHHGIIGLGFNQNKTIVDRMIEEGLLDKPVFSMYLNLNSAAKLVFGGSDPKLYKNDLKYVTAHGDGPTWQIGFNGVQVDQNRASKGKWYASLSLDRFISGPIEEIASINKAIGAKIYPKLQNAYSVDCSEVKNLPNIRLFIGEEAEIVLEPNDYIIRTDFDNFVCLSSFIGVEPKPEQTNSWVVGLPVLSKFYTEYDGENRRIGFADAL